MDFRLSKKRKIRELIQNRRFHYPHGGVKLLKNAYKICFVLFFCSEQNFVNRILFFCSNKKNKTICFVFFVTPNTEQKKQKQKQFVYVSQTKILFLFFFVTPNQEQKQISLLTN